MLGLYAINVLDIVSNIIWLPIALFWDLPILLLPFSCLMMILLSMYGLITKNYKRFYNWYRNLFVIIVYGIIAFEIENLFRITSFFKTPEYTIFNTCILFLAISILFTSYVEQIKKDARYYILASLFPFLYVIIKYISFCMVEI